MMKGMPAGPQRESDCVLSYKRKGDNLKPRTGGNLLILQGFAIYLLSESRIVLKKHLLSVMKLSTISCIRLDSDDRIWETNKKNLR
jgi:hypothetical protein